MAESFMCFSQIYRSIYLKAFSRDNPGYKDPQLISDSTSMLFTLRFCCFHSVVLCYFLLSPSFLLLCFVCLSASHSHSLYSPVLWTMCSYSIRFAEVSVFITYKATRRRFKLVKFVRLNTLSSSRKYERETKKTDTEDCKKNPKLVLHYNYFCLQY